MDSPHSDDVTRGSLGEVARVFLRLGLTAFGGPAAHIAMMEDELVRRRRWLPRDQHRHAGHGHQHRLHQPGPLDGALLCPLGHDGLGDGHRHQRPRPLHPLRLRPPGRRRLRCEQRGSSRGGRVS
nr:chromate transporter [Corallococcus sp. AB045]